jgi:hypothetical protein
MYKTKAPSAHLQVFNVYISIFATTDRVDFRHFTTDQLRVRILNNERDRMGITDLYKVCRIVNILNVNLSILAW